VVDQSKEHISDCKGLTDVSMATNLWTKWAKISQNGHNFSFMRQSMQSLVLTQGLRYQGIHL